jgi:hypothetical protein
MKEEVWVTLTAGEMLQAFLVGGMRIMRAIRKRRQEPYGHNEDASWEIVIRGVVAEIAVAKHLGIFWADDPALDYAGDVGGYQARSTHHPDGHLLLYPRDRDHQYFILVVTERAPDCRIAGFVLAGEGKRREFWEKPGRRLRHPGWMVPQHALRPIAELP